MEHATAFSLVLVVSAMSVLTRSYRRNRAMHRMQRGLRTYLGRAA